MTITQLIRLLLKNWALIALFPLMLAGAVLYLSQKEAKEYETSGLIYTSLAGSKTGSVGESVRMDYYTSNNMFDNMILLVRSREIIEKASLKLMAYHISLTEPSPAIISQERFEDLKNSLGDQLWSELAVKGDPDATLKKLLDRHRETPIPTVTYLLRESPTYGIFNITSRLRVIRRNSSDMMELVYKANDPGICKMTLDFIIEIFMKSYSGLKEKENTNAIKYFEEQLKIAKEKLDDAEARIKSFISVNNILNFYEQGKYLDIALLEQEKDEEIASRTKAGTESNLEKIEELFQIYTTRSKIIDEMIGLQKLLITKNNELEGLSIKPIENAEKIRWLKTDISEIQKEIAMRSSSIFEVSNSKEGVPRNTVLNEWLKLKIEYEQQLSSLEVMKDRKRYLSNKISAFAPLGAELKKLEREVSVNEGQYLSILHGLNMAYLKKYDLEMSSNQQIIDAPYFPASPLPSKKKIMVLGAYMAGFFLVTSLIIARKFLDDKINTPQRANKFSGLNSVGLFPAFNKLKKSVSKDELMRNLSDQMIGQILITINSLEIQEGKTKILIYSHYPREGKTFIAQTLVEAFSNMGKTTRLICPSSYTENVKLDKEVSMLVLQEDLRFNSIDIIEQVPNYQDGNSYDYEVILCPESSLVSLPVGLFKSIHLAVLVINAGRKWTAFDDKLISLLTMINPSRSNFILNKMTSDDLADTYGALPKKSSKKT
jgi:uncharacterized protein involved in exopolysaccharide biosynthesis